MAMKMKAGSPAGGRAAMFKSDGLFVTYAQITSVMIGIMCMWCAAGLVAVDMARLMPSIISPPLLAYQAPIKASTLFGLLLAGPVTLLAGKKMVSGFRIWQPFKGGRNFVVTQFLGWTLYTVAMILASLDAAASACDTLGLHSTCGKAYLCLGCSNGFLIALAIMALFADALLLGSLHIFDATRVCEQALVRCKPSGGPKTKKSVVASVIESGLLLLAANATVYFTMGLIQVLGKESLGSWLLIYGPIVLLNAVSLRDHAPAIYVFSQWLAIGHGLAHVFYPFLDEHSGVVKSVDVWQDQLLHLGQAALFGLIFFSRSGRTFKVAALLFVLANVVNVILGYLCWGQECHDMYVWVSLAPALASGLHHATGALYMTEYEVAATGFAMQGLSSVVTYFLFKASDDMLKFFALTRFFELYFIVPHYVGFFYSRWKLLNAAKPRRETRRSSAHDALVLSGIIPGEIGSSYLPFSKWGHVLHKMVEQDYLVHADAEHKVA